MFDFYFCVHHISVSAVDSIYHFGISVRAWGLQIKREHFLSKQEIEEEINVNAREAWKQKTQKTHNGDIRKF